MKQFGLFILLLLPLGLMGQNLTTYKASNGVTYNVGDTIKLGRGSAPNGEFVYLTMGGFGSTLTVLDGSKPIKIGGGISGAVIKKMKSAKMKGQQKVLFVVGAGNISNYYLDIENAIATCEVADCKDKTSSNQTTDKYEKLKKLKELLDQGVLTQEEYDKEKKKILEEN